MSILVFISFPVAPLFDTVSSTTLVIAASVFYSSQPEKQLAKGSWIKRREGDINPLLPCCAGIGEKTIEW